MRENLERDAEILAYHPIIDEKAMNVFLDKDIDYILWYRPFQQLSIINRLVIINNKSLNSFVNKYNEGKRFYGNKTNMFKKHER